MTSESYPWLLTVKNLHFGNTSALLSQFCQNFPFSHSFVRSQSDPEALLRFHHHHLSPSNALSFFKALKKDKEQTLNTEDGLAHIWISAYISWLIASFFIGYLVWFGRRKFNSVASLNVDMYHKVSQWLENNRTTKHFCGSVCLEVCFVDVNDGGGYCQHFFSEPTHHSFPL